MVACPFILLGHLLVVGFCDMTALLPRDSRAAPPSTLVLHRSWFISPPLNLTEDLTDKMLVHVNKMLVQFLVVLIYSSKVPVRCTEE